MSVTMQDLTHFRPIIGGCESPEPSVREVLLTYYLPFFTTREAEKLADEYLLALKNHLNTARKVL